VVVCIHYPFDKKLNQTHSQLGTIDVVHLQLMIHRCFSYLKSLFKHVHAENVFSENYNNQEGYIEMARKEIYGDDEREAISEECDS
jgi:hypothetical protein